MSMRAAWWCMCGVLALAVGKPASATVFFTDTFTYSDGQLTSADSTNANGTGANVSGGLWTSHSGTAEFLQVAGGKADVRINGTEDVNRLANDSLTPGETWYFGLKVTVNDLRAPADIGTVAIQDAYFAHFKEDGTTNFRGRLYMSAGTDPAAFRFGVSSSSTTPSAFATAKWGSDLAFGTEYNLIVAYTADDDDTNPLLVRDGFTDLWVNPANPSSTFVTDSTPNVNISSDLTDPMVALALRQQNVSGTTQPQVLVDVAAIGDDFAQVLAALGSAPPVNDADFDNDGDVDGEDFLTWQQGLGVGTTNAQGDANGDSVVNAADLGVWTAQFPNAVPAVGAVPEPASLALVVLGLGAVAGARRRRAG